MPKRRYFPCKICGEKIDIETIPDEELMWDTDYDEIAHRKCLPKDFDVDRWITTDEMRDACLPLDAS